MSDKKKLTSDIETAILEEYIYQIDGDHYHPDYMANTINRIEKIIQQAKNEAIKSSCAWCGKKFERGELLTVVGKVLMHPICHLELKKQAKTEAYDEAMKISKTKTFYDGVPVGDYEMGYNDGIDDAVKAISTLKGGSDE